jgi:hypothetical protein
VMAGTMIDRFHDARSLPDMLGGLSSFLDEMEFSCAEVRVPRLDEDRTELNLKSWTAMDDGPFHWLYRWTIEQKQEADSEGFSETGFESGDGRGLSTHFRLEFVFKITNYSSRLAQPFVDFQGTNIGRLTFYHPTTPHLPVSAVCLLSRQVWKEFGQAINRIMAQSAAGSGDQEADNSATAPRQTQKTPAKTRRPSVWAAPFKNRATGAHNRR